MDFYQAVKLRRTFREWEQTDVPEDTIHRILQAGLMAPSNNHQRQWEYIVLRDKEEKKRALQFVKDDKAVLDRFKDESAMKTPAQKMYHYAMPRQYSMLMSAPWVIIPLFPGQGIFHASYVNNLNAFASIWCVVENIFLAATAEGLGCSMRIPVGEEGKKVCQELGVPENYVMPCYIGIGVPAKESPIMEQTQYSSEQKIHRGAW